MGLKQVLIRNIDNYNFLTFDESLNMEQLTYLIKFIYKADYLTNGSEIVLENENVLVSSLKNNHGIVCHYWLKEGNSKNIGTSSSDEEQEEEN
jgi:hypothetical protein